MTAKLILILMCFLVPIKAQGNVPNEEPQAEVAARYAVIADAIAAEAGNDEVLARFLLTIAERESSFRKDHHSGKKLGDVGFSWGLYQIRVGQHPTHLLRKSPLGIDGKKLRARDIVGVSPKATRNATKAAAFYIRPFIKNCLGQPMCVFKSYAGVSRTRMKGQLLERLKERVAIYRLLTAKAGQLKLEDANAKK